MTSQNIQFLTVSEAQEITNKSQSTINRIVNKYKGSKHIKSDGNKHLISKNLLEKLFHDYPKTSNDYTGQNNNITNALLEAKNELIEILKTELGKKDQVITSQSNQISALTETSKELIETMKESIERIRESNIIIKSFQEQNKLSERAQTITTEEVKSTKHTNTPLIMDLHSQGMSYSKIAEQLNKQGLKNQYGNEYTRDAIKTTVNRNK
jgi:hypothetical protein